MRKFPLRYLIPICFLLGFCINLKNLFNQAETQYYDIVDASSWWQKKAIIEKGDTSAYHHVIDSIQSHKKIPQGNSFYYAFLMATKYGYVPANYDAFCALKNVYNNIDSLDTETKRMALFFLHRGAKLGDKRCQALVKNRYYQIYQQDSLDYIKE